ncbi:O-FucT domain protein [Ceratobasidium sp. AG-Ba]|nr:O-FucT domain protein [Ceratobasidium sp. AG-Ba]QRW05176.1 O-FucT domain protein [Ceratobasidium sp. AG-Ba]
MPAISPHSPTCDLEHGTTRRKRHARQPSTSSDTTAPATTRGIQRPFGSPWLKISARRARLVLVIVCFCLVGILLRSLWLPLLVRTSLFVYLPVEPEHVRPDRGSAVASHLNSGSALVRQDSVPSRLGRNNTHRFLTFLPHSGFNNQRIALENAMLLAYILNCTLIAPPARLGEPLPYRPFDTLVNWNELASRPKPKHCIRYPLSECVTIDSYAQIPWNKLVDFTPLQKELGLDIIFMHGSQTPLRFLHQMGVPERSITFLKDEVMYQHLIHDSPGHAGASSKYSDEWHLDYLFKVLESSSVVHFGTLFGSGRLKITTAAYAVARRKIHSSTVISHRGVLDSANIIRQRITGSSPDNTSYVAVHVRVTGRKFKPFAKVNGRLVWRELITQLGVSQKAGIDLERKYRKYTGPPAPRNFATFKPSSRSFGVDPESASSGQLSCTRRLGPRAASYKSNLEIPLFIATDAPSPRAHPALRLFFATFPCVYVLDDFQSDLDHLDAFRDADGLPMRKFLTPLVDMVVAGQATMVVGTMNSTFSDYITRTLHPAYSNIHKPV